MTENKTPSPQSHVDGPFAWYWHDGHGCMYITGDDRKPDVPAGAKPLYEHPPAPQVRVDVDTEAAIAHGAAVLTRSEDPAAREAAIRNALTMASQNPPPETHMVATDDLRKRVMRAIFDPGATEGFKGDRDLTTWQTDAVMRALAAEGAE